MTNYTPDNLEQYIEYFLKKYSEISLENEKTRFNQSFLTKILSDYFSSRERETAKVLGLILQKNDVKISFSGKISDFICEYFTKKVSENIKENEVNIDVTQKNKFTYIRSINRNIPGLLDNRGFDYSKECFFPKTKKENEWYAETTSSEPLQKVDVVNLFLKITDSIGKFLVDKVFEKMYSIKENDLAELNNELSTHGLKLSTSMYHHFEALDLETSSGATIKYAYSRKSNEVVGIFYPKMNSIVSYDKDDLKKMPNQVLDELTASLIRMEKNIVNSVNKIDLTITEKAGKTFS